MKIKRYLCKFTTKFIYFDKQYIDMNKSHALFIIFVFAAAYAVSPVFAEHTLAPDNLNGLVVGDFVYGRYFYYLNHTTIAYINISVDDIWVAQNNPLEVVEITVNRTFLPISSGYPTETKVITTALAFKTNRTVIMHAARMIIANATYSVELSVLDKHKTHYTDSDLKIKLHGEIFTVADIQENCSYYKELSYWYNYYWNYNKKSLATFNLLQWAIAPRINYGTLVNYGHFNGTAVFANDRIFGNYSYTTISVFTPAINTTINNWFITLPATYFVYEYNSGLIISWDEMLNTAHAFKRFHAESFGREGVPTTEIPFSFLGTFLALMVAIVTLQKSKKV